MAKDLDINFDIHDVDIKDSQLYRLWTRPNSPDSIDEEYPTGPPPGLDKRLDTNVEVRKPISPPPSSNKRSPKSKAFSGIVKYDGFCFHCNRYGHKPSQPNGCSLSPIEESEACKKAKRKVWEIKKAGRGSPTSIKPPTIKHQKW